MKKILIILFSFLCCDVFCNTFKVHVVSFRPPMENSEAVFNIRRDNKAPNTSLGPSEIVSWYAQNNEKPVGCASGFAPECRMKFRVQISDPECSNSDLLMKAELMIANEIVAVVSNITLASSPTSNPNTKDYGSPFFSFMKKGEESQKYKFEENIVRYIPNLSIKWFAGFKNPDGTVNWEEVGTTTHTFYVTHKVPYTGDRGNGEPTTFYETSVRLSCEAADGKGGSVGVPKTDEVVEEIFNIYTGHCVKKINGIKCMGYWETNASNSCNFIYEFFQTQDGACGIWAQLYNDMLRVQGINTSNVSILTFGTYNLGMDKGILTEAQVTKMTNDIAQMFGSEKDKVSPFEVGGPDNRPFSLLFVKNWGFNENIKFSSVNASSTINLPSQNQITYQDLIGVPAQGTNNNNPVANFTNHAIVEYTDQNGIKKYYDPSYGIPSSNQSTFGFAEYESMSMAAYGTKLKYQISPTQVVFLYWIHETENSSIQLNRN